MVLEHFIGTLWAFGDMLWVILDSALTLLAFFAVGWVVYAIVKAMRG
jgi:hypothetical protein